MVENINIAQVSICSSDTNFDLVTLHQFLKIPSLKRNELIMQQKIEFIDIAGDKINLIDGLRAITSLIKKLREEGSYSNYIENQ
ncbi:hypothetical protein [Chondrinema litorale]|uniref:hypothetical protein n=1 Tax=Chondrinema litorale TaxID=2994555 RepID=UPI0025436A31|nr:hypothetical protein [Chondrinema litorale]UZR99053.1 hypothetical protein OQ292_34840 [Chondrinema litorale]